MKYDTYDAIYFHSRKNNAGVVVYGRSDWPSRCVWMVPGTACPD